MESPEKKRKKQGDSIKLPQELQELLRQHLAPFYARGEKPPTRGDLLLAAWRCYEAWLLGVSTSGTSGSTATGGSTNTRQGVGENTDPPVINPTVGKGRADHRWGLHEEAHAALQYILESGPPGMAEDIQGNLRWFATAAQMLNERTAGEVPATEADDITRLTARAREIEQRHLGGGSDTREAEGRKKPAKKRTG